MHAPYTARNRNEIVIGNPIAHTVVTGEAQSMLRITEVESSSRSVTLRVEGRIAGPWLDELRTSCNVHTGSDPVQLHLELEDISFADAEGISYLKQLRRQGVRFSRVSPFLTELFKNDSSLDE